MPLLKTTSSVDAKCAAAVTVPVTGSTRSRPGAFSTDTSSVPSPTGVASTGRPSPVATVTGPPLKGGRGAVSRLPPAASGRRSIPGSTPRPSTPRPLDVSCTHSVLAPVVVLKTTTWLLFWLASAIVEEDSWAMPSGFCWSAKTCTTVPAGLSSVTSWPLTLLTQTLPLLATMTSSAFLTRANSGSELKLRGAGQTAGPREPVRAAPATPGAAPEIADNASPAKASKTAALSRPRVTILTTPPSSTHQDRSGLTTPGPAGHAAPRRAVSSDTSPGRKRATQNRRKTPSRNGQTHVR